MPAIKFAALVILGLVVLAAGLFTFVPSVRPPIVKGWFRAAQGMSPAKTPTEALDRFRAAIKKRDYETAAEFCDKDYREQMLKVAKQAQKLGEAIDSLTYQMDKNGVVNQKVKYVLRLLEPFPRSFKYDVKEKGNRAVATLADDEPAPKLESPLEADFLTKHGNMIMTLMPNSPLETWQAVELVKDDTGVWRLVVPVTTRLQLSVNALKDNATNYANAILQVRDEVRNNPVTKEQVWTELSRRLNESK